MRRGLAWLLALGTVVGATAAEAAVSAGTYKGSIKSGGSILVTIDSDKDVVKVTRRNLRLRCDDDRTIFTITKTTRTGAIPIDSDGDFVVKQLADEGEDGRRYRIAGRVRSPKITGTLQETVRINSNGQLDGDGSITCRSGKRTWSAKRQ